MKFHKLLVDVVNHNLKDIFINGYHADKVIETCLKSNKKWGARDRAFIAETTYECVRWLRLYDYCLKGNLLFEPNKIKDFYAIIAIHFILKKIDLPDWKEFKGINPNIVKIRYDEAQENISVKYSFTDWFNQIASKQLGENWPANAEELNKPAKMVLRVNSLKTDIKTLIELLKKQGIKVNTIKNYPDALLVEEKSNLFKLEEFKNGLFEIQDANSQMVAAFLNPQPGEKVIDACAGAGGKSLHIAALTKNKGTILSMDTEQWKLNELKKRAARNGAFNISTELINENTIKKYKNFANKLLLDVPCTGSGVIKRNPDTKWKLTQQSLDEVLSVQQKILNNYCNMLKVNGIMVYATCSILPIENQTRVETFLNNNKNYQLLDEKILLPAETGFDGFYMAKFKKNE
ncbi:MAG: RsmB/NOP family class I SAM-dependent RNA methyltransferase [Bacteroidia bacterium]